MFSTKTLMTIHEGIEKLAEMRASGHNSIIVTNLHKTLFERLQQSFNNPTLLKEVGIIYLEEFGMPAIAVKHFELAHQFAPKDRDIEQWQKSAALAMARKATDHSGHSGISEAQHTKVQVSDLIRKTSKITLGETRKHLDEASGEMGRKKEVWRLSGSLKQKTQHLSIDVSKELNRIPGLIAQTDFGKVATILEDAHKADAPPEELMAYYAQLGLAAFDYGRMEEALYAFQQMRSLVPEAVEGWFNCGLVYQKVGQLDDALSSYKEAVRVAPDNPKTWCNLSSVWFELGNFVEAEQAARKALESKTDYARAWDNLASALISLNRLPEAADACQQAIHIQPSLHSAWFKYGVINFQLDNLVKATEAFNLTGDNPDFFAYVLYYTSMIEARRGELDNALQKLSQARAADPGNDLESAALKELAAAFTKIGKYTTAADFYGHITIKHPNDFSAWLAHGTALHRAEQLQKARNAYLRATELEPENPVPWHNLGLLASDQEDPEESRKCFQREVELAPNDAKAWYDYGVSLQALGLEDECAEAFEKAEKLVKAISRRSSDLSAALSIVRRLNLGDRVLKE